MDALSKLKPCPFCGSTSVALVGSEMRCGVCCAVGPFGVNPEQSVRRWNVRIEVKHHNDLAIKGQKIQD